MKNNKMNRQPNFYITKENFAIINGEGFWKRNDVPPDRWKQIGTHFSDDNTLAVFASGSLPSPVLSYGKEAVGGIDWVKLEKHPKKAEPPLNAYHFVIGQADEIGYPVYGPYRDGCLVSHHLDIDELDRYLD